MTMPYDEETGRTGRYRVTDTILHQDQVVEYVTIDGERLTTTREHPFYTRELGWVKADNLWEGAHVRKLDGSYGTVDSLRLVERPQRMYNLTVQDAHTFYVGDGQWLVHNCGGIQWTRSKLQSVYQQHAKDFGFTGTGTTQNLEAFGEALKAHVSSPTTRAISGTYNGAPVTNYFNPDTGLWVAVGADGQLITGWKLTELQINKLIHLGRVR